MTLLQDFPQAKIITCILPDEGQDIALLKALRTERGIISANTSQCRGSACSCAEDTRVNDRSPAIL
jgi:hypothetical protein